VQASRACGAGRQGSRAARGYNARAPQEVLGWASRVRGDGRAGISNTVPRSDQEKPRVMRLMVILAVPAALLHSLPARAQGGPPFFTTDPGTPGNGHWELNVGAMATRASATAYELPELDVNYGLGERIQLSAQIPYVVQNGAGTAQQQGWGNALLGAKWRFLDQGEDGWQAATFPQLETSGSALARRNGFAVEGPRLLLPLELARHLGPLDVNFEAGHYLPRNGPHETFVGVAVGGVLLSRLEIGGELYADKASGEPPDETLLDAGFRYHLQPAFILMGMAGRSISGGAGPHTQFTAYLGLQILLSDYGRRLRQASD